MALPSAVVEGCTDGGARAEWVVLLRGDEVGVGRVRSAEACASDLVVWRTFAGQVCVMEARCPHLWSHLGAEGVVDGDELLCTAHFWRFDTSGAGSKVNMSGRRDRKGDIAVYECRERAGVIEARLASDG